MGGTRGLGAFTKGSEEAATLLQMFVNGELDLSASPGDVYQLFPTLRDKTATQFRSGFHRIREIAKESQMAISAAKGGTFFLLKRWDAVLIRFLLRYCTKLNTIESVGTESVKKPRKGIFKNTGEKLTEEQQEQELSMLNPLGKNKNADCSISGTGFNKKHSYLRSISNKQVVDLESDEDEEATSTLKCTNSTNIPVLVFRLFGHETTGVRMCNSEHP
jgi:hypothetical protein